MFYIYVAAASAALIIWLSMNKKIWNTIKFYMKYTIYCVYLSIIACLGMPLTLLHPASSKSSWYDFISLLIYNVFVIQTREKEVK